jgi:hypothetical protein
MAPVMQERLFDRMDVGDWDLPEMRTREQALTLLEK